MVPLMIVQEMTHPGKKQWLSYYKEAPNSRPNSYICKHEIRLKCNKENSSHVACIFSWKLLKTQILILALIPNLVAYANFDLNICSYFSVLNLLLSRNERERERVLPYCTRKPFLVQYGSWFFWDFWICKYLSNTLFTTFGYFPRFHFLEHWLIKTKTPDRLLFILVLIIDNRHITSYTLPNVTYNLVKHLFLCSNCFHFGITELSLSLFYLKFHRRRRSDNIAKTFKNKKFFIILRSLVWLGSKI